MFSQLHQVRGYRYYLASQQHIHCSCHKQSSSQKRNPHPRYIFTIGNHQPPKQLQVRSLNLLHPQASIIEIFWILRSHGLIPCPDHTSSPKKRKATGAHQSAPAPSSQPQYTSPPFSHTGGSSLSNTPQSRRRGHSRQRSDVSVRGLESYGRPASRHRHTESSFSTQSVASPPETSAAPSEPRRRSGGANPVSSILEQSDSRPQSLSQSQRESQFSAGSEMRHDERRISPDGEDLRRGNVTRDEARN
jgi:hypothetical protein